MERLVIRRETRAVVPHLWIEAETGLECHWCGMRAHWMGARLSCAVTNRSGVRPPEGVASEGVDVEPVFGSEKVVRW